MLKRSHFFICLILTIQLFCNLQNIFANHAIEDGDLLLKYEEVRPHEFSLGSYSDYKVITPPQVVRLSNRDLYKNLDEIKNALAEKKQFALMYDHDEKVVVLVDTTLIKGEANVRTSLWDGWEHKVGVEASDLEINTGFRKMIYKNTLVKFEDVFEVDGDLNGLEHNNKVIGSVNFNF